MRKIRLLILALIVCGVAVFALDSNVSALSIEDKSVFEGLVTCYNSNGFVSPIKIDEYAYSSSDYYKNLSLVNSTGNSKNLPLINGKYSESKTNCTGILIGNTAGWRGTDKLFGGLQRVVGLNPPSDDNYVGNNAGYTNAVKEFMDAMGYGAGQTQEEINSVTKCFNLPYDAKFVNTQPAIGQDPILDMGVDYTNYACFVFDKNNKLIGLDTAPAPADQAFGQAFFSVADGTWTNDSGEKYDLGMKFTAKDCAIGGGLCSKTSFTYWYHSGNNYSIGTLKDEWYQKVTEKNQYGGWKYAAAYSYMSKYYPGPPYSRNDVVDKSEITTQFTLRTVPEYGKGVLADVADYDTLKFSDDEKVSLYRFYLKNVYKVDEKGCFNDANNASYNSTGYEYKLTDSTGTVFTCIVSAASHPNDKVNGLNSAGHFKDTQLKFSEVLAALDGTTVSYRMEEGETPNTDNMTANGIAEKCMSNAEAESLSWIVCPGVDGLANGSDGIYGVIKDMLVVDSNMISDGADSPTYQIWKYFRDFANVIFIILILIVIISQVTGFGIDNYGIKKMLPRLIICAVLVNLSYIICQFAVDLSNIVGSSINLLLSSWANTVSDGGVDVGLASIIEVIIGGGGAAVAGAAPFAITAISVGVTGWWLVLIIVVIMLLVILIAVLVVFLMLGARQLIVVVAVAIAPVAIICYALPNTEKLFKRWLDIFKAALVMFPIVSALSGLGQVVQAIVFGAGGEELAFSMALLAAACPFLPFLVLPSLLKSSLKAVGDLGGKLTGLKNRAFGAAHTANSSLRNTDAYKDAQFQTAMARNTRRLAKFKNADGSWIDDSKLSAGQLRRRNLYQRRDLAFQKTNLERENLDKGGYDAGVASLESAQNKQALDNEMILMAKDTSNYDTDVMNKQLEDLLTRDTALSGQDELRMKALMQKLATGSGYGKKLLAKTVGNASTATRAQAAKFMSKSGEVAGAINSKNLAAGQYLREVNAGTAGADSFSAWKSATRTIKVDGQDVTMSNAQFVLSKVATDDADFVGQSAGAVAEGLGMKEAADGSYVVNSTMSQANVLSDARLADMINNERLMDAADSDVRRAMVAAANARGLSVPAKYGGAAPEAPTPVINNPTPVAPVDPTQLNIQHPAPQIQTPTQPASASTPAPQSIRDQILNVQPGELEKLKAEADRKMNGGRGPNV